MVAVNQTLIETSGQLPQAGTDLSGFLVNIAPATGSFFMEISFTLILITIFIFSFAAAKTCICEKHK